MKNICGQLYDFVFPQSCIGCGLQRSGYLCPVCKKSLLPHTPICPVCHQHNAEGKVCNTCRLIHDASYDGVLIGFAYQHVLKKLILRLKFYHQRDIASFLAQRLALLVQTHPLLRVAYEQKRIYLTYVPSHRVRKYRVKGYNQSFLLAKELGMVLDAPLIAPLFKSKITARQTGLSRQRRLQNLRNAFSFSSDQVLDLPADALILIVDDVITTGATLAVVAKALRQRFPHAHIRGTVVAHKS